MAGASASVEPYHESVIVEHWYVIDWITIAGVANGGRDPFDDQRGEYLVLIGEWTL